MLGDSLFAFYDWQGRFADYTIINKGLPGETVAGLLGRVVGEVQSADDPPDMVIVMIGTNNVAMDNYTFLPDYGGILHRLRDLLPKSRLVVTSLLPLQLPWLAESAVARLNELLRELAARLGADYLNIYEAFAPDGIVDRGCFLEDGVHLTDEGYSRWARVLEDFLAI